MIFILSFLDVCLAILLCISLIENSFLKQEIEIDEDFIEELRADLADLRLAIREIIRKI